MHSIGEKLLYGSEGVVEITDIREESFGGISKQYYVLRSCDGKNNSETFVPTDSELLLSRMRPLLTKEEVLKIISDAKKSESSAWISDGRTRSEKFKRIIMTADRAELIQMIKSIYLAEKQREKQGKRISASDENAMKKAERLLYSEFAAVLGIAIEDVPEFIVSAQ